MSPKIVRTWAKAKISAAVGRRRASETRTQAVVANARKRISSPNGATITPASSDRANPMSSRSGAAG